MGSFYLLHLIVFVTNTSALRANIMLLTMQLQNLRLLLANSTFLAIQPDDILKEF